MLGICSTLLLIYASLVPLKYTPLSWEETQTRWRDIAWLSLGIGNRADWIANALVVMPSAFLFSGAVDYRRKSRWSLILLGPLIFLFLAAIVLGIELVQVWFPPRTVSQNDIFAGWVGAAVGIGTWAVFGRWMAFALEYFVALDSALARIRWIVGLFCVLGILHNCWPFDFVFSWDELARKSQNGKFSLMPSLSEFNSVGQLKGLINESIKMLFVGIWVALRLKFRSYLIPLFTIAVICILLELAQVPVFSRHIATSQVIAGCIAGWIGWFMCTNHKPVIRKLDNPWIWGIVALFWSISLLFMFNVNSKNFLVDQELIAARWRDFFTPPLVGYYYTSEYRALSNLIGKTMVFAVSGILTALVAFTGRTLIWKKVFLIGFIWSGCIGIVIEILQLFLPPAISNATDIAIYVVGYSIGFFLVFLVVGNTNSFCDKQEVDA